MEPETPDKLTRRDYWESVYRHGPGRRGTPLAGGRTNGNRIGRFFNPSLAAAARDYADYLLWYSILPRFLPREAGLKVLEVGSAPGINLLKFRDFFGYDPYGLDYSEGGVELNRRLFEAHGIDPAHVIRGDIFSDDVRHSLQDRFDVVASFGFIEHFTDAAGVIARHVEMLKKNGFLIVGIPNISGANYRLTELFHREVLGLHNIRIMNKTAFGELFKDQGLRPIFAGYYGTFTFYLFNTKPASPARFALAACRRLQRLINLALYMAFGGRGWERPAFSPYLLYVGRKE